MKLSRRYYITSMAAIGSIGLSGCSGILGDDSSGPAYEEEQEEEMLLSVDSFPDGWVRNDAINENFDAVFANEDESIIVLTSVDVGENVSEAKEAMDASESGYSNTNEIDIGDEAFWATRNDQVAYTIFRHSNAVGQVAAARESGAEVVPDQSRSQQYAREMVSHWQDI